VDATIDFPEAPTSYAGTTTRYIFSSTGRSSPKPTFVPIDGSTTLFLSGIDPNYANVEYLRKQGGFRGANLYVLLCLFVSVMYLLVGHVERLSVYAFPETLGSTHSPSLNSKLRSIADMQIISLRFMLRPDPEAGHLTIRGASNGS
jgi:hypothetical protein